MPLREGSADADKLHPWPADKGRAGLRRFVLTHLADLSDFSNGHGTGSCQAVLSLLRTSITAVSSAIHPVRLRPLRLLYVEAARRRGADPFIGRSLGASVAPTRVQT
ncbi:hypothetical protein EOA85_13360 [Mesorhizobium sp. M5C.F.Ca.IN.020.29.1.1]|uniref:hypothetical protein n=1 Tax=Mesorhizobium sp. M5C.F.Ca.IN.020.29.1.1 TaxID=2496770 RepID=UPI000FCB1899|nr:hypothetical protein [Mesorhizobium sp. M5C.F.Ca.IN.020.29.1.1]RUV58598.1 hypothetical protein EOA85_13360 [Mesorhizobium sp. M5C.F.Ca.IN.020.29.1.1]TJW49519.1 MAG: hypothetical protein E5X65_33210 [Mesorhizobium sp.]